MASLPLKNLQCQKGCSWRKDEEEEDEKKDDEVETVMKHLRLVRN
jgi:hypothetical protein